VFLILTSACRPSLFRLQTRTPGKPVLLPTMYFLLSRVILLCCISLLPSLIRATSPHHRIVLPRAEPVVSSSRACLWRGTVWLISIHNHNARTTGGQPTQAMKISSFSIYIKCTITDPLPYAFGVSDFCRLRLRGRYLTTSIPAGGEARQRSTPKCSGVH
jgi:hypothetical protein